jgi:hypothetical protein
MSARAVAKRNPQEAVHAALAAKQRTYESLGWSGAQPQESRQPASKPRRGGPILAENAPEFWTIAVKRISSLLT